MIRSLVVATLLGVLTACGASAPNTEAAAPGHEGAERPPNFVVIMADDLGWGDLEPYGQEKIHTPSLTRMAEEGTRFTAAPKGAAKRSAPPESHAHLEIRQNS